MRLFVIYANGTRGVTLSPRVATGTAEPQYDDTTHVELLSGSGVGDGRMTANVRCFNCSAWNGGSMDLKSDIAEWTGAYRAGQPLDSTDPAEKILYSGTYYQLSKFNWGMVTGRGGDSSNPFVTEKDPITADTGSQNWGGQNGSSYNWWAPIPHEGSMLPAVHGSLAALAFLIFFPGGAIFVRFAKFKKLVWVHAAIQIFGYCIYIAAAGIGIWMMLTWHIWTSPHPKIGMALLVYLFIQPFLGLLHHWLFGKKGKRNIFSHIHRWGGRLAIVVGIINGGLGLKVGEVASKYKPAYGVVATVTAILFLGSIIFAETTARRRANPSAYSLGKIGHVASEGVEGGRNVPLESMDKERLNPTATPATTGDRID